MQREAGQLERRVKQLKSEVGSMSGMIDWQIWAFGCVPCHFGVGRFGH